MKTVVTTRYEGQLRSRVLSGPSSAGLLVDCSAADAVAGHTPTADEMPCGDERPVTQEALTPTHLLAASLASCILSVLGRISQRHGVDICGSEVEVTVESQSVNNPLIRRVDTEIRINTNTPDDAAMRSRWEAGAARCPIHCSLNREIDAPIRFVFPQE